MNKQPIHLRLTLPALIMLIIAGGVWVSFLTYDPHWLNRSGALVSAVAAGAILLQIRAELQLEVEADRVDSELEALDLRSSGGMPIDILASRLSVNRLKLQGARISQQRLVLAMFVVSSAIVGELLHGFGDLLMCYLFCVCGSH
jgi:hypothetical protein